MSTLEPQLREVVDFIRWYKQHFVPDSPSLAAIADHTGVSKQTAANYVNKLVELGELERDAETGRLIIPGEQYTLSLP